jgi:hypothetical protein
MAIRLHKVLGGVQPPRARKMARKRKATEAERRARKSPTRLYKPQRDFIGIWLLLLLPYSSRPAGLPGRKSSTQQTTGLHRTMTKVCKSNGEGTFAGTRGNGEVAPIPAVRGTTLEPRKSTLKSHCWPRQRIVRLTRKQSFAPDFRHANHRLKPTRRLAPLPLSDRRCRILQ